MILMHCVLLGGSSDTHLNEKYLLECMRRTFQEFKLSWRNI